jgi:hypothetical protein
MTSTIVIVNIRYLDDTDEQYHNRDAYMCYDIDIKAEFVRLYMRELESICVMGAVNRRVINLIIPMNTIRFISMSYEEN